MIGVGASSSIPQYNLREMNEALIKVLWNSDIDFEEIYIEPDFATGATIINADQVKESHKTGNGFACKIRSTIEYDAKERTLNVVEIPYMVYTNTICKELEELIEDEKNPGIDRFNDLTGKEPLIKIYLKKNANVDKVLKFLYKNTSLQSYYSINFTMLENGRYPKVYNWKELLIEHINHELIVYSRGFEFDLKKIEARLHIIEGLLKAINVIDEVVKLIKSSSSSKDASIKLQEFLSIDATQAKAILDIKLSRLAHLEVNKLITEKEGLEKEKERLEKILSDEFYLKKEVEKGLREVADKFGDARRTKIINIAKDSEEEPTEVKQLVLNFTNQGNIFVDEGSTLYTQKKGGVGSKFKLDKGEYVVSNRVGESTDTVLFFSNRGNFYHLRMSELPVGQKTYIGSLITINSFEEIRSATILSKSCYKKYIVFITKKGILKKSLLEDYNITRSGGARAIDLATDDEIVDTIFINEEPCGILTASGNILFTQTKDIRAIGRIAKGIKGIKLNDNDYVVSARIIPDNTKTILSITSKGLSKRTSFSEFNFTGKNTKGKKVQKIVNNDSLIDFLPLREEKNILVISSSAQLKVATNDITLLTRDAQGSKTIKLNETDQVVKLGKI